LPLRTIATIDELQADLDAWMTEFNEARPHQGKWCFGKTSLAKDVRAYPSTIQDCQKGRGNITLKSAPTLGLSVCRAYSGLLVGGRIFAQSGDVEDQRRDPKWQTSEAD